MRLLAQHCPDLAHLSVARICSPLRWESALDKKVLIPKLETLKVEELSLEGPLTL
jgi:hypothetical protein